MKMALKDGKILIKDADSTQGAVIRSWNRMRCNCITFVYCIVDDFHQVHPIGTL